MSSRYCLLHFLPAEVGAARWREAPGSLQGSQRPAESAASRRKAELIGRKRVKVLHCQAGAKQITRKRFVENSAGYEEAEIKRTRPFT